MKSRINGRPSAESPERVGRVRVYYVAARREWDAMCFGARKLSEAKKIAKILGLYVYRVAITAEKVVERKAAKK